jgi:hypothetical protein
MLSGTSDLMAPAVYSENVEARAYVRGASQFYTADEQAVFAALQANAVRKKARFGLHAPGQKERWERELAAVDGAPPMDAPVVVAALADGEIAFRDRVWDRIWLEHKSEFDIPRCPECDCILKSHLAQQCLWCGHDWH